MQGLLIAVVTKVVEIILRYLIAWGEKSIAKQQEIKRRMEEYKETRARANRKAEEYENNSTPDNRDAVP